MVEVVVTLAMIHVILVLQHMSRLLWIYKAVQQLELKRGSREVKSHASVPQSEVGTRQV